MAYCQKSTHSKVNKTMMNRNKMISLLTATSKPCTYIYVHMYSVYMYFVFLLLVEVTYKCV